MSLAGVSVLIDTDLDLTEATAQITERGQSLLFTVTQVVRDALPATVNVLSGSSTNSGRMRTTRGDGTTRIYAPDGSLAAEDLIYLSYLALESRLNRRGLITLHGAAVERDGRAVLLLGHAGAGKTSAALLLCREHGYRLVGNDLVVVGGIGAAAVVAGTTHLRLRRSAVARCAPDLLSKFGHDNGDSWRSKMDVTPSAAGIAVAPSADEIAAVVFVRIQADYPAVVAAAGDTLIHRLNLYENALRYARGASTPWLIGPGHQFGPYVPSFDTEAAHNARTATLDRLLARSHYVAGPAHTAVEQIAAIAADVCADAADTGGS